MVNVSLGFAAWLRQECFMESVGVEAPNACLIAFAWDVARWLGVTTTIAAIAAAVAAWAVS